MLIKFEQWLWGCWCSGPCQHTHTRLHEWFWNTEHLYPFTIWLYYYVIGVERPEL